MKIENIPKEAKDLMRLLIANDHEAYIVGGWVRDTLLGNKPHDIDIFTSATGDEILKIFPQGKVIGGEERQAKILTVVVDGIEVSQYRSNGDRTETGHSLTDHLLTCDFTINALACDIEGNVIDEVNGLFDLQYRKLHFVGEGLDRIREDPLRILRALRLKAQKGFYLSAEASALIDISIDKVMTLPKERIAGELVKILSGNKPFDILINHKILMLLFPKYGECIGVSGGPYHNEVVSEHILNAARYASALSSDWRIVLAAFLHDIGKGEAFSNEDGEIPFFMHEEIGALYAEEWMTEYKFAKEDIKYVSTLVREHMWGMAKIQKKKAFLKHFAKLDDAGINIHDFVLLKYCDNQANMANPRVRFGDFVKDYEALRIYYELKYTKEPFKTTDLVISGKDLIARGHEPGPKIGWYLDRVFELVQNGELVNERPALLNYIKEFD